MLVPEQKPNLMQDLARTTISNQATQSGIFLAIQSDDGTVSVRNLLHRILFRHGNCGIVQSTL
jgi:hypothetical protein